MLGTLLLVSILTQQCLDLIKDLVQVDPWHSWLLLMRNTTLRQLKHRESIAPSIEPCLLLNPCNKKTWVFQMASIYYSWYNS